MATEVPPVRTVIRLWSSRSSGKFPCSPQAPQLKLKDERNWRNRFFGKMERMRCSCCLSFIQSNYAKWVSCQYKLPTNNVRYLRFCSGLQYIFFRKVNATRLVPAYNRNSMSGGSGNTFKRSTVFTHSRLFFIKLNEIRFYENPQHKTFRWKKFK